MLKNLSKEVRECLRNAEDCARKAAHESEHSPLRQDFLKMERRWLDLARSVELTERLTDFSGAISRKTDEITRKASAPIIPFLRGRAFDPETVEAMGKAFVSMCAALGLSEQDGAMTRLVAKTIIELAQRGYKNPVAIRFAAMMEFKSGPQ